MSKVFKALTMEYFISYINKEKLPQKAIANMVKIMGM